MTLRPATLRARWASPTRRSAPRVSLQSVSPAAAAGTLLEQTEPDQRAGCRLLPTGQVERHGPGERADRDRDQCRMKGMPEGHSGQQVLRRAGGDPGDDAVERLGRRVENGGPRSTAFVVRSTNRERAALGDMGLSYPATAGVNRCPDLLTGRAAPNCGQRGRVDAPDSG